MEINYERVVCMNLNRRPEKWMDFKNGIPADFPFGEVERYPAIDGRFVNKPDWWHGGNGAWGCFSTHRRIIEECLNNRINSVLIFEDDAMFLPDFSKRVLDFHNNLPDDAQWLYYGGQHLKKLYNRPVKINDFVYRPYNVNRTHAYSLIGRNTMQDVLTHINRKDWTTANHIDHHFGRMHQERKVKVYCPAEWLVDQRSGKSDVAYRSKPYTHWADANYVDDNTQLPFIAVLGCHSSGSSALAGVLFHLGIHLGNKLAGAHGKPPINGGEAVALAMMLESAYPVPATQPTKPNSLMIERLRLFIKTKQTEASNKDTVAAGKYPQLAFYGKYLPEIVGKDNLKIIVCRRSIEESIESLSNRIKHIPRSAIAAHQKAIAASIDETLALVDPKTVFEVEYSDMLANPEATVDRLIEFCELDRVSDEQRANAIAYINPSLRHVG